MDCTMSDDVDQQPVGPLYGLLRLLQDQLEQGAAQAPEGRTAWLSQQREKALRYAVPPTAPLPELRNRKEDAGITTSAVQELRSQGYEREIEHWFAKNLGLKQPHSDSE
ncbi:MAG: hypothetical protein CMN87_14770 [Stappia sp.]|nr:hypothetical protein [Stappia sp.]